MPESRSQLYATHVAFEDAGLDVEVSAFPYIAGRSTDNPEAIERDAAEGERIAARLEIRSSAGAR